MDNFVFVTNTINMVSKIKLFNEYCRTKVRGVTKFEVDWDEINPGDELTLESELGHIFFVHNGKRIGYLKPVRESSTIALMGSGFEFKSKVLRVTGGTPGKPNRGINILVEARAPTRAKSVTQDSFGKLAEAC